MGCWLAVFLLIAAVAGFASPALAEVACPAPLEPHSFSEACTVPCQNSGSQAGHPAGSSASSGFGGEGYNFSSNSALTLDNGYFSSSTHTGGSTTIAKFNNNGAQSRSEGDVGDCLTFTGGVGGARAHIPITIQGEAFATYSIAGAYVPPSTIDPAYARFTMHCAPCTSPYDVIYDTSQAIDITVDLAFDFIFGVPLTIQYGPRVLTQVYYTANGSDSGFLQGTAELELEGLLLPMYVTDFSGVVLPTATVTATSGFDYVHPAPEPAAVPAELVAIAALVAAAARVRPSR
jgi:hypothetical protein